jgi:hypothetical protein
MGRPDKSERRVNGLRGALLDIPQRPFREARCPAPRHGRLQDDTVIPFLMMERGRRLVTQVAFR